MGKIVYDTTTVVLSGQHFKCEYFYQPGKPGQHTMSNGEPGYPSDPDEIELHSVKWLGVDVFDLLQAVDMFTEGQKRNRKQPILPGDGIIETITNLIIEKQV